MNQPTLADFDAFVVYDGPGPVGAQQTRHKFPNGYGASIIRGGSLAYGGYELAVLKYDADGDWGLTYNTPITDDVIGYLDDEQAAGILFLISRLGIDGKIHQPDNQTDGQAQ